MPELLFDYSVVCMRDIAPFQNNIEISLRFMLQGDSPAYVLVRQPDVSKMLVGYEGFGAMIFASTREKQNNIYIVDNNIRGEHARLEPLLVVDGTLSYYLVGDHVDIVKGTWYHLKMKINKYNAVGLSIWEEGTTEPLNWSLMLGGLDETYEQYYPLSGPSDTNFGIYVDKTRRKEYFFDDILITPLSSTYSMLFMRMEASELVKDVGAVLLGYGTGAVGEDEVRKTQVYAWHVGLNEWQLQNENIDMGATWDMNVEAYRDPVDNYVNLLVKPTNPSSGEHQIESALNIDFFKLEQKLTSGYHLSNTSDLYIKPDSLNEMYQVVTLTSVNVLLTEAFGFNLHPMVIKSIQLLDLELNPVEELVEGIDYTFIVLDAAKNYSVREENEVRFNPLYLNLDVRINYHYFWDLNSVQGLTDSSTERQGISGKSILTYTFLPAFLTFDIYCKLDLDVLTVDALQTKIVTWVDGLGDTFSRFDFLTYLAEIDGVEDVVTSDLKVDISMRARTGERPNVGEKTLVENIENYTRTRIQRYFTYPDAININLIS